jgi:hypothetical protein
LAYAAIVSVFCESLASIALNAHYTMRGGYFHIIYYMSTTVSYFRDETTDVNNLIVTASYVKFNDPDAIDFYDFEIIGKQKFDNKRKLTKIKAIPKSEQRKLFLESGADFIMNKPIKFNELKDFLVANFR